MRLKQNQMPQDGVYLNVTAKMRHIRHFQHLSISRVRGKQIIDLKTKPEAAISERGRNRP